MVISCNPIWSGGEAPGEILPGINRETEAGGNKEAASKHREGWREVLGNKLFGINTESCFYQRVQTQTVSCTLDLLRLCWMSRAVCAESGAVCGSFVGDGRVLSGESFMRAGELQPRRRGTESLAATKEG